MANDIAVSMYLNNQKYMQGMNASKGALLNWNKQIGLSQKTMQRFEQTMDQSSKSWRVNQSLISNSIFMVEDAASVYGTMGLAGSVRAASNNLTMMAMAFGPWTMAAAVAASTATQLYFALNKDADAAEKAKNEVDEYKNALDEQAGRIDRLTRLRRDLANADDSNQTSGMREQAMADQESIKNQIEAFKRQKEDLEKTREQLLTRGQMFEQAAGSNPQSAAAIAANAAFDEAKKQQSKIEELEGRLQKLIEERGQKEEELAMIRQKHNKLIQAEVVRANNEEIAALEEKIRKDREAADLAIQNQNRVAENQHSVDRNKPDKPDRMRADRPANPSGARMGDREFSERMAKARRQGFVGPDLSQRQQQSIDTMQKNKDRLQQDDLRPGFDKQRKETIAEIDRQIQSVKDAARGRQQKNEDRDNKQSALDKATQENTKQQKMTVAALDRLAEEIQRRAADREQSGRMVQIGGLTL